MKRDALSLGDAAAKAARHRVWRWCRRENGFSDKALWRVVARDTALPLVMVQAFVNRLEELANAADHRGHVAHFDAEESAAAHDIEPEQAARIFAALERRGWIEYDHVADFHDRNPDREDETATERKRRQRARQQAMCEIARLAAAGQITPEERQRREIELLVDARLSTGHGSHNVTPRDIVTVTPEQSTALGSSPVDNSGDEPGGVAAGQQDQGVEGEAVDQQAKAELWLLTDGAKLTVERLQIEPGLAKTYVERWRRDLNDDIALKAMIEAAEEIGHIGPRWHSIVTDQVRRRRVMNEKGPELPLIARVEARRRHG